MRRNSLEDIKNKVVCNSLIDSNGCWNYQGYLDKDGYPSIKYNGKTHRLSRMCFLVFNGVEPNKMLVCHTCDNPTCVNPLHLFLGTAKDNIQDCVSKDRKWKRLPTDKVCIECGKTYHCKDLCKYHYMVEFRKKKRLERGEQCVQYGNTSAITVGR